eukprot:2775897-Pyramimonas_sp.AAC.1
MGFGGLRMAPRRPQQAPRGPPEGPLGASKRNLKHNFKPPGKAGGKEKWGKGVANMSYPLPS